MIGQVLSRVVSRLQQIYQLTSNLSVSYSKDLDYLQYLSTQIGRSLATYGNAKLERLEILADMLQDAMGSTSDAEVLAVGARSGLELQVLAARGFKPLGIDLLGNSSGVRKMDMHDLDFQDGRFDAVFASHVLEHAYDPVRVGSELTRVTANGGVIVAEVPVNFEPSGADRHDFLNQDMGLLEILGDEARETEVLRREVVSTGSPANPMGTDVLRFLVRLE